MLCACISYILCMVEIYCTDTVAIVKPPTKLSLDDDTGIRNDFDNKESFLLIKHNDTS